MHQSLEILNHLKDNGSITPLEALNRYGCMRLGARIFDLRSKGYPIKTEILKSNKKYAIYKLMEGEL
ncbi:helix-turn-helix domain-containing protein [Fastidiosibacter lacustris]|uniref:helix-turn-helix domain-containing protein n=1 Tax=Fastidiosibacter lacustris TaxID=2056695 RepID=UPI000E3485C3|nr:helix-turn-helix domain-containing protein [Fastidiosibacter lacustris]